MSSGKSSNKRGRSGSLSSLPEIGRKISRTSSKVRNFVQGKGFEEDLWGTSFEQYPEELASPIHSGSDDEVPQKSPPALQSQFYTPIEHSTQPASSTSQVGSFGREATQDSKNTGSSSRISIQIPEPELFGTTNFEKYADELEPLQSNSQQVTSPITKSPRSRDKSTLKVRFHERTQSLGAQDHREVPEREPERDPWGTQTLGRSATRESPWYGRLRQHSLLSSFNKAPIVGKNPSSQRLPKPANLKKKTPLEISIPPQSFPGASTLQAMFNKSSKTVEESPKFSEWNPVPVAYSPKVPEPKSPLNKLALITSPSSSPTVILKGNEKMGRFSQAIKSPNTLIFPSFTNRERIGTKSPSPKQSAFPLTEPEIPVQGESVRYSKPSASSMRPLVSVRGERAPQPKQSTLSITRPVTSVRVEKVPVPKQSTSSVKSPLIPSRAEQLPLPRSSPFSTTPVVSARGENLPWPKQTTPSSKSPINPRSGEQLPWPKQTTSFSTRPTTSARVEQSLRLKPTTLSSKRSIIPVRDQQFAWNTLNTSSSKYLDALESDESEEETGFPEEYQISNFAIEAALRAQGKRQAKNLKFNEETETLEKVPPISPKELRRFEEALISKVEIPTEWENRRVAELRRRHLPASSTSSKPIGSPTSLDQELEIGRPGYGSLFQPPQSSSSSKPRGSSSSVKPPGSSSSVEPPGSSSSFKPPGSSSSSQRKY
ncbi:hypothetical protein O181_016823 [Austropuccinia psidii MF-1]|uniref:Uncharacterized protein n=1 Tax=Austropuccinia psidii MF-1 TaxID=1389203 RepID=A0A9Q3C552_9BASI|nr:hypothetical protein [Austropuccinia psidii MF-1]